MTSREAFDEWLSINASPGANTSGWYWMIWEAATETALRDRDAAIEASYKEGFNTGWLHCSREEFEETSDDGWRMSDARTALTAATIDREQEANK